MTDRPEFPPVQSWRMLADLNYATLAGDKLRMRFSSAEETPARMAELLKRLGGREAHPQVRSRRG